MTSQSQQSERRPDVLVFGAAAEHAIVRRVTDPKTIRTAMAAISRRPTGPGHSCWIDKTPVRSGSPSAVRLIERERYRPLGPGDDYRIVLVRYSDQAADLVVVARRGAFDQDRLHALVEALVAGDEVGVPVECSVAREASGWSPSPAPAWGLAGTDAGEQAGTAAGDLPATDPALAVAATAVTLARYEDDSAVRLAVVDTVSEPGRGHGPRVLRIPVVADRSLADFVDDVRAVLAGGGERTPGECPAVCVVLDGSGPDQTYLPVPADTFALALTWRGSAAEVRPVGLTVDRRRLHPVLAHRLHEQVVRITGQLARGTVETVGDLELIAPAGAAELGPAGCSTVAPSPTGTVHERISRIAAATPEAPAVSDGTRRLSYRELDARATAWARVLAARGAGPGRFVGVCLKRNVDLVVALLAVLKTGAAYVPLDVQYPGARLEYIARDAGLDLVITARSGFPAGPATEVMDPAELDRRSGSLVDGPRPAPGTPQDPAYAIYTSGTTGRPKGVVVPHGNVLALIDATAGDLALTGADVWSVFHSAAFDFSVWEIWGGLLTGGHLVVVPFLVTRTPEEFRRLLARDRVTVLSQTPSAFTGLIAADARAGGEPLALRVVVLGGEAFNPGVLGDWFRRYPDDQCRLVNMYGITETTVHVTAHTVRSWAASSDAQCVGRPIPGWSVSVRDSRGRVLPPGVRGEIWVAGAGLATGYLHRPELTAERFPVDDSGERHYRSGDRGLLRLDGTLVHTGRLDDQVKVRGFRIELGEVRAVLLEDSGVTDAVVVLEGADEGPEHVRLAGYVVLTAGTSTMEVRRRVAAVLPDYMTPATLISLPALPLTINGKLDRSRLPVVPVPARSAEASGSESADPLEAMVAVWRSVISVPLGPDDDFFELGGNSLVAVRLLDALRAAGFPTAGVRDLYLNRTAAALTNALTANPTEKALLIND